MDRVFVLTKNEGENIVGCLRALRDVGWPIVVLDSGSTDGTVAIARATAGVEVEEYVYRGHAAAYNYITAVRTGVGEVAVVLDADMRPNESLIGEIASAERGAADWEVLEAPIDLVWCGRLLRRASLCPPMAIAFRGGREYFEESGHGERLVSGVRRRLAIGRIVHDDRKDYLEFLKSQLRYARSLGERVADGKATFRDRVRTATPLLIVGVPIWSWLFRGGWRDGRAGALYALDRVIAEALMFREAIRARLER